jgi:hypothetical protein
MRRGDPAVTVDVRARLAEGAEAVADQLPPIHDWYYAEAGVRLEALAADAAALASAAGASEEALLFQRAALEVMTEGWRGGSGYGAVEFLSRHCSASTELVAALRDAAAILTTLGTKLEHVVGVKVDAALCGDWTESTRTPAAAVAVYDEAIAGLGAVPLPRFEIPLAPQPPAAVGSPADSGPAPPPMPLSAQPSASSAPPGLPAIALPNVGGSLAELITTLAQALGSYSDVAPVADPPDAPTVAPEQASPPDEAPPPDAPPPADAPPPTGEPLAAEEFLPAPAPPDTEVPAVAATADSADTPCEIAADELPQVGQ